MLPPKPAPAQTLLRSAGRGTSAQDVLHLWGNVSELSHRRAPEVASTGVVQEILGHANIRQTMDTYSHVLPNMQQAAERMDQMLG